MVIKKYLTLIVLLLLCSNVFSQTYNLDMVMSYNHGHNNNCSLYRVTLFYSDGSSERITDQGWATGTRSITSYKHGIPVTKRINSIEFFCRRYKSTNILGDCAEETTHTLTLNLDVDNCHEFTRSISDNFLGDSIWNETLSLKIEPNINIFRGGTPFQIGYDDEFEVFATNGFLSSDYRWYFKIDDSTPNNNELQYLRGSYTNGFTQNTNSPNILLSNTFSSSIIGKTIYFKIKDCHDNYSSNFVSFQILPSAPKIVSSLITPTTCSYSSDAKLQLTFSRALHSGEQISYSISYRSVSGEYIPLNTAAMNNISSFDTGNTITFENLPSSTHYRVNMISPGYYTGGENHQYTFYTTPTSPVVLNEEPVTFDTLCNGGDTCLLYTSDAADD